MPWLLASRYPTNLSYDAVNSGTVSSGQLSRTVAELLLRSGDVERGRNGCLTGIVFVGDLSLLDLFPTLRLNGTCFVGVVKLLVTVVETLRINFSCVVCTSLETSNLPLFRKFSLRSSLFLSCNVLFHGIRLRILRFGSLTPQCLILSSIVEILWVQ